MITSVKNKSFWFEELELNTGQHAVVYGAPGSGKTELALKAAAQFNDGALILANSSEQKKILEQRAGSVRIIASAAVAVATVGSFALDILKQEAAINGDPVPSLIPAAAQDELIKKAVADLQLAELAELQENPNFCTEIRDVWRVLDERNILGELPGDLLDSANFYAPLWRAATAVVQCCRERLAGSGTYTADSIANRAAQLISEHPMSRFKLPKLVLVDDAADLLRTGENLLVALAHKGVTVWLFADPDTASTVYKGGNSQLIIEADRLNPASLISVMPKIDRVYLPTVHRQGSELRRVCEKISQRIGARRIIDHRKALAAVDRESVFKLHLAASDSERISAIAYELRAARLLRKTPLEWSDMMVICRTRSEVERLARELKNREVPTTTLGGGVILKNSAIVRDLVTILETVLSESQFSAEQIIRLLSGPLFGVSMPKLRNLQAHMLAVYNAVEADAAEVDAPASGYVKLKYKNSEKVFENFIASNDIANVTSKMAFDNRAYQALLQLRTIITQTRKQIPTHTVREMLWQIWSGAGIAEELRNMALGSDAIAAKYGNEMLDAVCQLFHVFKMNETESTALSPLDLCAQILRSDTPQTKFINASAQQAVIVTTANSVAGLEAKLVCVTQLQSGQWPNLKKQGSMFAISELTSALDDETADAAEQDYRTQVTHDELRLFLISCSRASSELHLFAMSSESEAPSQFWNIFGGEENADEVSQQTTIKNGLTLRDRVASLRYQLELDPDNTEVAGQLARFALQGVPGANPAEWYGYLQPSTARGVLPKENLRIPGSRLDNIERCPLETVFYILNGKTTDNARLHENIILHDLVGTKEDEDTLMSLRNQFIERMFEILRNDIPAIGELKHRGVKEKFNDQVLSKSVEKFKGKILASNAEYNLSVDGVTVYGSVDLVLGDLDSAGSSKNLELVDVSSKSKISAKDSYFLTSMIIAAADGAIEGISTDDKQVSAKFLYISKGKLAELSREPKKSKTVGEGAAETAEKNGEKHLRDEFHAFVQEAAKALTSREVKAKTVSHCELYSSYGIRECQKLLIPAVSWQDEQCDQN
ncbi:hypothetical protein KJY77_01495 [Canibacter sp. lx-72]|nr:hypothetical protein [Canibacter zhuwentaonis]